MSAEPPSDPVERAFYDAVMLKPDPNPSGDPYQSEEYQRFVDSMMPLCHCAERYRPCDGVLAGGVCDGIKDERDEPNDDRRYDEDDE